MTGHAIEQGAAQRWVDETVLSSYRDVTSCSLLQVLRRFGGTYCLCIQGWRISHGSSKQSSLLAWLSMPSETSMNIWRAALSYISEGCIISFYISVHCHAISVNSLDSDGLPAGWPGFGSHQGEEIFLFSIAFKLDLGFTELPIRWVTMVKREGAWSWPLTSI
jgi:hypothetical protein